DPAVFAAVAFPDPALRLETALIDLPRLGRRVRVVVVIHQRTQRIALLFSTDLDLDPGTLYRYYKARFQIEFLFRDSKQFAGLTHCQARRTDAFTFQVNASLTAVSLSKLQAVQTYGHLPTPFSMASLVRRCFNEHFLQKILAYLAPGQTLTENSPEYETLCNYGIINPVPT
ncbi:MAG: transposase, partial [Candidatus Contendobacter sp.]